MKKYISFAILSLLLVGCGGTTPKNTTTKTNTHKSTPVIEEKTVIASFYPIAFIAEQITHNTNTKIINLAKNSDVHTYTPSPQDMVQINKADLVLYQGALLEPWTNDVIPALKKTNIATLEVSHNLDLAKIKEHEEHHDEHEENHHDYDDHHKEEKEKHHEEDEHNHGEFDPHTWLDPILAQNMVEEIAKAIINIDAKNKPQYTQNAEKLKQKFAILNQNYAKSLQNCQQNEVIISHDAFGYIASRYNFTIHPIAGLSTLDKPSAKVLAELKEEAQEGITHILVEDNNIKAFAETIARETGLNMLNVNPLGRGTQDPNKDFFNVMQNNLKSFSTALACQ